MLISEALGQGNVFYFDWEPAFMVWLQTALGPFAEKVCPVLSMLGEEYVMIAVFAVFYLWLNKEAGRFIGTNFVSCLVWNPFIKNIFLRFRPYMVHDGIQCLKPVDPDAPLNVCFARTDRVLGLKRAALRFSGLHAKPDRVKQPAHFSESPPGALRSPARKAALPARARTRAF